MPAQSKIFVFRCDSSEVLGTGHFHRSLSLAKRLKSLGHHTIFVTRRMGNHSIALLEKAGVNTVQWEGLTESELAHPQMQVKEAHLFTQEFGHADWVVVDHYSLDHHWERVVRDAGLRVLAIDDLFRQHCSHALLDQNFHRQHAQLWHGKVLSDTRCFLGPRYVLLNADFEQYPRPAPKTSVPKRALAFFGGTDPYLGTERFLEEVEASPLTGLSVTLLIGSGNARREALAQRAQRAGLDCIIGSQAMARLFSETDLYLGAGGSISWERAYFGVPGVALATATNQVALSAELDRAGTQRYLGILQELPPGALSRAVQEVLRDPNLFSDMSRASLELDVARQLPELLDFLVR